MNREDLIAVLPCYACGDLPPELMESIGALIASDPEIRALAEDLAVSQDCCEEAMRRAAPTLLRLSPPAEVPASRPVAKLWPVLVTLAALLVLGVLYQRAQEAPSMSEAVAEELRGWSDPDPRSRPGFIAGSDPAALSAALTAAGVQAPFNQVRPVGVDGVTLVGVAPLDDGGLVILMVDAQGREFSCVVLSARSLPVAPAEVLPAPEPGLVELRSFPWGSKHGVVWTAKGMTCVLLGDHPRAVVEAMAMAKVWGA